MAAHISRPTLAEPAHRRTVCVPAVLDRRRPLRESLLLAAVYIMLASNLNLMIGYAGYVNFGNIVFFGLGGYICVYLVNDWHWPLLLAALAGGVCVSAFALLFGLGILRLRGAFFALATIGVNEAVRAVRHQFRAVGRRHRHLSRRSTPTSRLAARCRRCGSVYFLIVAVMGLSLLAELRHQEFEVRPRPACAIGQNEDAAAVLGVKTPRYKALVYSISAFLPGDRRRSLFLQERHHRAERRIQPRRSRSRRS